jgi:hypothetical protein
MSLGEPFNANNLIVRTVEESLPLKPGAEVLRKIKKAWTVATGG